jgi:uncharacterized cupin superfamily protein
MAEEVVEGDGYSVASLDALGEGYGFRKVRRALGVSAFGANAVVLPPGYVAEPHYHFEQEELYICLQGTFRLEFGDGSVHLLEPGAMARVAPETVRAPGNGGATDCTYVCVGGKDGYVGRDAHRPDEEPPDGE